MINKNYNNLDVLHLGPGNVGKAFLRQLKEIEEMARKNYGINLKVTGIFDSKRLFNSNLISHFRQPTVIVDTTASDGIYKTLIDCLKKGAFIIMSNKKPLSSTQEKFDRLFSFKNRLFFETTVGAGLPIISTINELIETGDDILEIEGCFSGTLGYLFTEMQKGGLFSEVIAQAKKLGYTEPDPRDDLSGVDAARKVLILSRILGRRMSFDDVKIESLSPNGNFETEDDKYKRLMEKAKKNGKTLRYVAKVDKKSCTVGIREVSLESDIGSLSGPDNIISIKTKRYHNNPLVIKGQGAGVEVTAAGVLGDLLKIIKIINGYHL